MITKEELDQALVNTEVGKKLRFTFPPSCLSVDPMSLRKLMALGTKHVIDINPFQSIRLLGAIYGDGWGGSPVFDVAIGSNFSKFNRQTLEAIMLGCALEKIETI